MLSMQMFNQWLGEPLDFQLINALKLLVKDVVGWKSMDSKSQIFILTLMNLIPKMNWLYWKPLQVSLQNRPKRASCGSGNSVLLGLNDMHTNSSDDEEERLS